MPEITHRTNKAKHRCPYEGKSLVLKYRIHKRKSTRQVDDYSFLFLILAVIQPRQVPLRQVLEPPSLQRCIATRDRTDKLISVINGDVAAKVRTS